MSSKSVLTPIELSCCAAMPHGIRQAWDQRVCRADGRRSRRQRRPCLVNRESAEIEADRNVRGDVSKRLRARLGAAERVRNGSVRASVLRCRTPDLRAGSGDPKKTPGDPGALGRRCRCAGQAIWRCAAPAAANCLWNWPSFMIASSLSASCRIFTLASGLPSTSKMSARKPGLI